MSKNRSYLEQIDDEIAFHRKELEQLQIARQVIARLGGNSAKAETTQANEAPTAGITIRRIAPATPAPKAKAEKAVAKKPPMPRASKADKALLRETILSELKAQPQTSTALIAKLRPDADKSGKQTIYDALYHLKIAGVLARSDDALYHIASEPVSQQATSH